MSRRFWWENSVDITVSPTDCIPHIKTDLLKKELNDRLVDKISDPCAFDKEERERGGVFSIAIDPEDYDLIDKDDVTLEYFTDEEMIEHIEKKKKYTVVSSNETFGCIDNVITYLQNLPKHKFRSFMCDVLCLCQRATNDDIINELKEKI